MSRSAPGLALILIVAACATPEVAEEYEARTVLPGELQTALASEDPTLRADAASQVMAMEPETRRAALLALCRDERAPVRLLAVGLLAKHHATDEAAVEGLAEVLSLDADLDVRATALSGLARSGRHRGLRALVDALTNDPSLTVRRAAAEALDRLTGQGFGHPLVEKVDEAEEAADEAMMAYDDWFESHGERLRFDEGRSRFVIGEQE